MHVKQGVSHHSPRCLPLDGLRGVACLGIVFYHAGYSGYHQWLWTFVDLFFVLSGFLISRIILRGLPDRSFSLVNFVIHRALRIGPVYYLTLAACVLPVFLHTALTGEGQRISGLLSSPIFLQFSHYYLEPGLSAPVEPFIPGFAHSWSLAVEEQFYILLPMLLLLLRNRVMMVPVIMLMCLVAAVYFRYSGAMTFLLVTRMDGLAVGVLLGLYWVYVEEWSRFPAWKLQPRHGIALTGLAASLVSFYFMVPRLADHLPPGVQDWRMALGVLGFSLGYGLLVLALGKEWLPWLAARLASPPLIWLGGISYALYMYHWPIRAALLHFDGAAEISRASVATQVAYFLLPVIMAVLSREWMEKPILALRRHFPLYRRQSVLSRHADAVGA